MSANRNSIKVELLLRDVMTVSSVFHCILDLRVFQRIGGR